MSMRNAGGFAVFALQTEVSGARDAMIESVQPSSRLRALLGTRPCGDSLLLGRAATTYLVGGGASDWPLPSIRATFAPHAPDAGLRRQR